MRQNLLLALLVFALAQPALAQVLNPDDVMVARRRVVDEESSRGIRAGSFIFSQGLNLNLLHDDNIFRTSTGEDSDLITQVKPALAVEANWARHGLFLGVNGDLKYYRDNTSENSKGHGVMLSGHYDIAEQTWLMAALSRLRRQEARGSVLQDTNRQLDYTVTTRLLEFTRALSYVKLKILGQDEDSALEKDKNPALAGANDYRARNNRKIKGTIAYEYMPLNDIFLSASYDTTDYALVAGADRDSDGTDLRVGWNFDNARALSAKLYGGRVFRDFSVGSNTAKTYAGGGLTWKATALSSLSFVFDKSFEDATANGSLGAIHTTRKLIASHSLNTALDLQALAGIDDYNYVGGTFNGSTRLYYTGLSAEYEIARGLGLRAGYDYMRRAASQSFDKYKDNRVFLSLVYMF